MAKKHKAAARGSQQENPVQPGPDAQESRKRIRDYEDVAASDDEFHIHRDKVLLGEEPDAKRRRKWQEQEEFLQPSDEEVLDYSDAQDEEDEDEDEDFEDGDDVVPPQGRDGFTSGDEASGNEDDEEDGIGWGTSKADLYGADAIETEEQALEEEAEALRLQKKQLQAMSAADYGFDESEWQAPREADTQDDDRNAVVTEVLPQLQISDEMGPAERLKLLKSRYPEFEPLSKDLLSLKQIHPSLLKEAHEAEDPSLSQPISSATTKLRAASAYIGALTMYFSLMTSPASTGQDKVTAMSATHLRDHPIMDTLVACRAVWHKVKDLRANARLITKTVSLGPGTDRDEDAAIKSDNPKTNGTQSAPKEKKTRAQRHAEAAQAAADSRKAERIRRTEADLIGLDALIGAKRPVEVKQRAAANAGDADSDIGEEAPLTTREAAEKAQRKKSLRFYTSQIAQKASKRGSAGRNAGGDDDVPHRERLRDRQARLNAEAERRGKRDVDDGAELGGESDEDDARQAEAMRQNADDDDYYDMVAARTAKKKSDKAALAVAQREAALQGGQVVQEETVGADGKRKISYAIEKNKGLTPHRKKDVRNPRVKKRKKFEEKKKKLASIKPVYKGGPGRGGYGGELTGIKKGLVKSTKL